MVTFLWTTFLVFVQIVSLFPEDSRALQTVNNPHKIWSLSTRPKFPTASQHGRSIRFSGNGQQVVPLLPQWHPILWSKSTNEDSFNNNNPLAVNNKDRFSQKWKLCTRRTRNCWKALSTYFLPPILAQTSTPRRQWYQQFYPRFVIRETLLGIRIMMRIYSVLVLVGWIFEACYPLFRTLRLASLETFSYQSPLHILDVLGKQFLLERLPFMPIILRLTIMGPILEEFSYRGLGFLAIYWEMWWGLFLWSFLVRFSPILGALWMSHNVCHVFLYQVPRFVSHGTPLLELVKVTWLDWIPPCLLLPLQIRLLQLATTSSSISIRKQPLDPHHAATIPTCNDTNDPNPSIIARSDTVSNPSPAVLRRHERIVQQILHSRKHSNSTEHSALDLRFWSHQIQMVLVLLTRWKSSSLFAAAHIPGKGTTTIPGDCGSSLSLGTKHDSSLAMTMMMTMTMMGSKDQYLYLRKFWGVFTSSMLIESRLVSQRGTLWGACGAHMCFNTLTLYRLIIMESLLQEWGINVKMIQWLSLIVGQWLLDRMGKQLEQFETRFIREEED